MLDHLSGLAIFVAVVEAQSFTAAAATLGLSKSAVSKAVSRLESRLGARLLNRTTRRLSLTEAGQSFYERCAHIVAEAEEAAQAVTNLQGTPRGQLRVNAPVTFGAMHLAPLLPDFMRRYPELAVDMVLNDRRIDLVEEGFDIAIRIGRLTDSTLVARKLCDERHVLCAAPAYWDRHGRPAHPHELTGHNCLTYAYLSTGEQWQFDGPDGPVRVRIGGTLRSNNGEILLAAAIAGNGVALMPHFACARDLAAGRLEEGLANYRPPPLGIYALHAHGRRPPAKVRAFIDFLADRLGRDGSLEH